MRRPAAPPLRCGGLIVRTNINATRERTKLTDACQAYLDGEFETCLALCDEVEATDDTMRFDLAVMRARVHVRVDRGDRALEALRFIDVAALSVDRFAIAQLLLGAAYVRLGQKERGAALLCEAMEKGSSANSAVRAEVALQLGIAKFRLGAHDEAEKLFASINADQDILHAHALEYRGWVAYARTRFEEAASWFRASLAALSSCQRRDRYVEGKALYGLTAICPELLLVDDWPLIQRRVRRFDWSLDGLSPWQFWVHIASSLMCEMTGDSAGARRWARQAESLAQTKGYHVVALCRLAAIFRGLHQPEAHAEFTDRARCVYERLDLRELGADLQQLPLFLAEEVAHTVDPGDAEMLLAQYRDIILPGLKSSSGDIDQFVALERSVEAVLHEARGDNANAARAYSAAYVAFSRLGYRRRAASVALRLARLTGRPRYVSYVEETLRSVSPQFWMMRELVEVQRGAGPPLTETERGVLRLLAQGKTYKEIAAARSVSVKTVGNHVQALFRKFDVHSRGELTAEALRRRAVTLHHPYRDRDRAD